jgi:hypothetical protein
MKFSPVTFTLCLATIGVVSAAPASVESESGLTKREVDVVNYAIANLDEYNAKRDTYSVEELAKRESQIVTDVLTAINSTDLAPAIIKYFVDDPDLSQIAQKVIIDVIKSGVINLSTLLKSLNDSGLAVSVIQNLINDCAFYAEIYKLALNYISNLASEILLMFEKREYLEYDIQIIRRNDVVPVTRDTTGDILTSLMESLKNSGLANSVVDALVVDDNFYSFGASLIQQLLEQNLIDFGSLISAIISSGLVPSLIENFLNIATFKTVIVNALAAAFGKCDGTTLTTVTPTTTELPTISTVPSTIATSTTTSPVVCKKRRRSYNY